MLIGSQAFAQSAPAPAAAEAPRQEEIVVTGSLISRPDYQANSPIVSVGEAALANTGQITVERALAQMPQFSGSGIGQSNTSSTGTGLTGGQSYASLRGLGSKRALILLDGKRLQPSNPDGSVDLNTIPEALVGNVEVITGGASTTYGSDATAGVINFRLKRDFTGLSLKAQTGITNYGDGDNYRITATAGGKFADDRGRAFVSLDYSKRERAKSRERPWNLARIYVGDVNQATPYGLAIFTPNNQPTLAAVNGVLSQYGKGTLTASNGNRNYIGQLSFNNDGTLWTVNGAPVINFRGTDTDDSYLVPNGNSIYGPAFQTKFAFRGGDTQSNMNRYMAMGRVDYELTDAINAYGQFSYTTYNQDSIVNTTLSNNFYTQHIPYNSYFVPADLRAVLASRPNPTAPFDYTKQWLAVGNRGQTYKYNVWQAMVGMNGELGIGDLTWDAYGSTSVSDFYNGQTGGLSAARLVDLLSVTDGNFSRFNGCTNFNIFGDLPISQACKDYILRDTLNTTHMKQNIVQGTVQGSLFKLPAGDVRFAVGADYRSNSFFYKADGALNQPPGTSYFADGGSDVIGFASLRDSSGEVKVKELFGELFVPVLQDLPFIKELNLDFGYRYSDYNSIGSAHTYKVDFDWRAIDEIRFRGGYNRAIRAPSVGELFAPVSNGSTSIGTATATGIAGDPCDVNSSFRRGSNEGRVRALCLAQGMDAGTYTSYTGTAQVFPLTGGNPDLKEETADTLSFGAVLTSPFESPLLRQIRMSVDWYDIKIKGAIGTLSVANSLQACFNADGVSNPNYDANNYYCTLLGTRQTTGRLGATSIQPLLNLGQFEVSGIDVQFDWRAGLEDFGLGEHSGVLALRTIVSYLDKFDIQDRPGQPTYNYAGSIGRSIDSSAGITHPRWKANTNLNYSLDKLDLSLTWRFLAKMKHSNLVTNPSSTTKGIASYNVFDLNIGYTLPGDIDISVGSTNIFNKAPPSYTDTPATYDSSTYDVLGRTFFMTLAKKF
nr:TonB-dependent receptor [Sphingomonas quercus]